MDCTQALYSKGDIGSFKGDIDMDVEVDVDIDTYFGCLEGFSMFVEVLFNGIDAVMVLTLITLN